MGSTFQQFAQVAFLGEGVASFLDLFDKLGRKIDIDSTQVAVNFVAGC